MSRQIDYQSVIRIPEEGFPEAEDERTLSSGIPAKKRDKIDKILIPEAYIKGRIKALAQEVCRDYQNADEVFLVTVLQGAFIFASDLGREIYRAYGLKGPEIKFDFIKAVTYGEEIKESEESARKVRIELKPRNLKGKDVILIEDLVDQGFTLWKIKQHLLEKEALNSLKVCVLFNKVLKNPTKEVKEIKKKLAIDYLGFEIPDRWIAGYGIDAGGDFRHLPYIITVREDYYLNKKKRIFHA